MGLFQSPNRRFFIGSGIFVTLCVIAVGFQNCNIQGRSASSSASSSSKALSSTPSPTPSASPSPAPSVSHLPETESYITANGKQDSVTVAPNGQVLWAWKMKDPVINGRTSSTGCDLPEYNEREIAFSWANGTYAGQTLGSSSDANRAGCIKRVCLDTISETKCVDVHFTSAQTFGAKANGFSGNVARRADTQTLWQWKTESAVIAGTATITQCKDPSFNQSVNFFWANGTTSGELLGSSSDYRRDGCRQELCFVTTEKQHCVAVYYHMEGSDYYVGANGQRGVVLRPADQATLWQFKTESPITRSTVTITGCNDPSFNVATTDFTWANGQTQLEELGSSSDARRVGCHQEVCSYTQGEKKYCVTVIYR